MSCGHANIAEHLQSDRSPQRLNFISFYFFHGRSSCNNNNLHSACNLYISSIVFSFAFLFITQLSSVIEYYIIFIEVVVSFAILIYSQIQDVIMKPMGEFL